MRRSLPRGVMVVLAAYAGAVGCGEPGASGGAGSGGGATGSGGAGDTTGSGNDATGSGGAGGESTSDDLCTALCQGACSGWFDCSIRCPQLLLHVGPCAAELDEWLECALGSGDCGSGPCAGARGAFDACHLPPEAPCGSLDCVAEVPSGACTCKWQCDPAAYETECTAGGACTCRKDEEVVGTCDDSVLTCDVFAGCCSAFFAGGP